jgi:hypothetical protein
MLTLDNIVIYGEHTVRLRRDYGGVPVEIAEMRRVKTGKGPRRLDAHEVGKGPKEQNSSHRHK